MTEHPLLISGLTIDWTRISDDSYLRNIRAIQNMESLTFHEAVTFFVGENGSGKSTLLKAIAVAYGFNPEGGTRNYRFSTYDSHSELCDALRLHKSLRKASWGYFLRAESFYNVATKEEEYSRIGGIPENLHRQSHGESFLAVAQRHFKKDSLFLLDEPEAALSPQRQMTLLLEIDRCIRKGSQFIIVTHSPILLSLPHSDILSFDDGPLHSCTFEETHSYQVMSMFINHREKILHELLEEE